MKIGYFRHLIWILALVVCPTCSSQVITIRVLNEKNGHPLQKQPVIVSLLYEKSEKPPAKYDAKLGLETDANGEAKFALPDPPPEHFAAQVNLTSAHWHCGCMALASTEVLIQKGFVERPAEGPDSKKYSVPVEAEPKEITFLAQPFTFLERLLYPFIKD
jgi:hypothetical protein